ISSAALFSTVFFPATSSAQQTPRDMVRRFTVEQWDRFRPLFTLVEESSQGHPVPSEPRIVWQPTGLKAEATRSLVLFTTQLPSGEFASFPIAMYLRVVKHGAVAAAPGPRDALAQYPFEDVALFDESSDGRVSRAFAAPPGQWDVYVALSEAPPSDH